MLQHTRENSRKKVFTVAVYFQLEHSAHLLMVYDRKALCSNRKYTATIRTFFILIFFFLFIIYLQITSYAESYGLDGMVGYVRKRTLVELR